MYNSLTKVSMVLAFVLLSMISSSQDVYTIYVSTEGNDDLKGGKDTPLRSIEKAVLLAQRADKTRFDSIMIYLRAGYYKPGSTIVLTASNSGTENCPVIIRSYPGEWAVITGAELLERNDIVKSGSRENEYYIDIGNYTDSSRQLISQEGVNVTLAINGKALNWSSSPDNWMLISDVSESAGSYFIKTSTTLNDKNNDLWVGGYWKWDWAFSYNKAVIASSNTLKIFPPYHEYRYKTNRRFKLYNVNNNMPLNTFCVNQKEGGIHFKYAGEVQEITLSIKNKSGIFCNNLENVKFQNLVFDGSVGTFLKFNNCSDIVIEECIFHNTLETPIVIKGGSNVEVTSCVFKNLGGKGVEINAGDRVKLTASNHIVSNSIFSNYATIRKTYNPAISINGVGVTIRHNLIENAPHAGIIFKGNNHTIEYNELRNLAAETADVGVIYSGRDWSYRGNLIKGNYIHNSLCAVEGTVAAIYLDDLVSGTNIEDNIINGVNIGILVGGGQYNDIAGNVLIDCMKTSIHIDNRAATWASKYAAPGGSWNMWKRLSSVNYQSEVYKKNYPELARLNSSNYKEPVGNTVANNRYNRNFIDFKKKTFYSLIDIYGNTVITGSDEEKMSLVREELNQMKEPPGVILNKKLNVLLGVLKD